MSRPMSLPACLSKLLSPPQQGQLEYAYVGRGGAYEGDRNERGEWEGKGVYHFSDGTWYEGEFVANMHHGHGTIHYASGASYEGEWRAGKKHGKGTYRWDDGRVEVGLYRDDSSVGEGVMWSADMRQAWRIVDDGRQVEEVTLAEAARVADRVGEPVPIRTSRSPKQQPTERSFRSPEGTPEGGEAGTEGAAAAEAAPAAAGADA